MYCGTSRKFKSSASDAMTPVSSSCSSSSSRVFSDGSDLFRGLASERDDVERFSDAAALALRELATRDDGAGFVWKDMLVLASRC